MDAEQSTDQNEIDETAAEQSPRRASRVLPRIGIALACLLVAFGVFLFFTERWLFETWESLSPDELLFHIQAPFDGTNSDMVWEYLNGYGSTELFIILAAFAALFFSRKHKPLFRGLLATLLAGSFMMGLYAVSDCAEQISLAEYLAGIVDGDSDFIAENYIDPATVELDFPQQRRNVIYIYLESMELTFADTSVGGAFDENVIPELTQIALANECFNGGTGQLNGGITYPGTGWTMGAMFAQSTGIPLKVSGISNEMASRYDNFLEGLVGLGDILDEQGYRQVLLIGSDAVFGGRSAYFTTHGGFEIRDYGYALENGLIPEGHHVFWGYEDSYLFDIAKQTLGELAGGDQPFNLTLLTVDTHFEDGYVCELCDDAFGDNQYSNVMACSSRQVAEFVAWLQEQDFYEDTTIIICGDHPTMDKDYCEDVPKDYRRRTFTAVINAAVDPVDPSLARVYSTMDMFPTTLAAMGIGIEGERLGLGTNLFSDTPTLTEELGFEVLRPALMRHSSFLDDTFELGNSEEYLARASERVRVEEAMYPGGACFVLRGLRDLNHDAVERVDVVVTDTRTGESVEVQVNTTRFNVGGEKYSYEYRTGYTEEDLPYIQVEFLITVTGVERYPIAHWEYAPLDE